MTQRRDEARLQREILLALGREADVLVHPNPVGQGYHGAARPALEQEFERVMRTFGAVVVRTAREVTASVLMRHRVTYGLGVGSPDLVGAIAGTFVGLELKSDTGRISPEQTQWHAAARARGALVEVVRSVDEAREVIARARRVERAR